MPTQTDPGLDSDDLLRSAPPALPRAEILGVDLAVTDYERTMDWLDDVVRRRDRVCVTAAAVHLVMVAREDPDTPGPTACRSSGRCARSATGRRRACTAPT